MKKNLKVLLSFLLVLTFVITGCAGAEKKDGGLTIGLSMNTLNNPFFVDVKKGAEAGAKEIGAKLIVTDAQNDSNKQLTDIENILQKNPDLIIIDPTDSDAIISGIEAANSKDVPVITIDRQANGGNVIAHIGFDAIKSGGIAGEYIAKEINGKGKVVEIQGILGTNVAQDRSKGFNDEIAKHEDITIVAKQSANFDRSEAMSVMENILQANPEIDAVYAANDEMALGALEAIVASGRMDDIVLIGCDSIDPAIEKIKEGQLNATISEPPFYLGKTSVEMAKKYLDGEKLDESIILDSTLVTKDNVDEIKTRD